MHLMIFNVMLHRFSLPDKRRNRTESKWAQNHFSGEPNQELLGAFFLSIQKCCVSDGETTKRRLPSALPLSCQSSGYSGASLSK